MPHPEGVLNQGGLYTDELTRKLRILNPGLHQLNQDLLHECEEFLRASEESQETCEKLMSSLKALATYAAREKTRVISFNSKILHVGKEKIRAHNHLKGTLQDRQAHLDALVKEHESLLRVEKEMEDAIGALTM
jgi:hypothetical protein